MFFLSTLIGDIFNRRQLGFYFSQCCRYHFLLTRLGLCSTLVMTIFLLTLTRDFGQHPSWLIFLLTSCRIFGQHRSRLFFLLTSTRFFWLTLVRVFLDDVNWRYFLVDITNFTHRHRSKNPNRQKNNPFPTLTKN